MTYQQAVSYVRSSFVQVEEQGWWRFVPGLALVGMVAFLSLELAKVTWLQAHGISVLTLAIVLGMVAGNTIYPRIAAASAPGVVFSKQKLLRAGIILYGLRLTFQDIAKVGVPGVAIDAVVLSSTFALSCWAGTRLFKMDRCCAMLIGAGSSICGAAAVMAAEPVIGGRSEQVTTAVSTVVVFGTFAMLLYPLMYALNAHYGFIAMTPVNYGIYVGSTVHEVAQVVAAGRAVAQSAADTAVITKMVRVMMLAPFLITLSAYLSRQSLSGSRQSVSGKSVSGQTVPGQAGAAHCAAPGVAIPWFALGFVAVAGINSLNLLPSAAVSSALSVDTVVLAMAMAALGVTTHVSAIRTAGMKPLGLAALLFAWLIVGGLAINAGVSKLLVPSV